MARPLLGFACVWLASVASLAAANVWDTKPFLDWSDKETQGVMNDSPWATVVGVALPPQLPVAGSGDGGGRGGRGGDDMSFGPGPRRIQVTISWRSALPIKQAIVRTQVGQHGTVSADQQTFLTRDDLYVIALSGLPRQFANPAGGATIEANLKRNGKAPIPATEASPSGPALLVAFPKSDRITLADGEIELVVKLERLEVKKKFKLKDMVVAGNLEL